MCEELHHLSTFDKLYIYVSGKFKRRTIINSFDTNYIQKTFTSHRRPRDHYKTLSLPIRHCLLYLQIPHRYIRYHLKITEDNRDQLLFIGGLVIRVFVTCYLYYIDQLMWLGHIYTIFAFFGKETWASWFYIFYQWRHSRKIQAYFLNCWFIVDSAQYRRYRDLPTLIMGEFDKPQSIHRDKAP